MADISKITLPSGNTYDIKDATARELIAGGITFNVVYDGTSTPEVANIPEGVVVTYNGTDYTGTKTAASADAGTFYLVASGTSPNAYDEYIVAGPSNARFWERLGGKDIDLSNLGSLAYKDNVTLAKGSGDNVLGEATTFTASSPGVTVSSTETEYVLGTGTTFNTTVTPSTTNIKATASGTAVGADGTAAAITGYANPSTQTFVKSVSAETSNKLVTTTVPNVTNAGSASTWAFAMGTGTASETLIISGANGSAPTLGTAKTVATGSVSSSGTGSAVVTGVTIGDSASAITALGTPTTETVLKGVKVTAQPTVALSTGATAGTGVISVATGITSASTTADTSNSEILAVTDIGQIEVDAPTITVGANDKVKVAKYDDLSVSAS